MQPHPEHQQNDADLRQLVGQRLVGDEARRERPEQHAREQIADQRRGAQAMGQGAEQERKAETGDEHGDQGAVVHASPKVGGGGGFVALGAANPYFNQIG